MSRPVLVTQVRALVGIALCLVSFESPLADAAAAHAFDVPSWLFPINPPASPSAAPPPAPDRTQLLHVPNSQARFTRAQVTNLFSVPDWHPAQHPPMPAIVAQGRKPAVYACGYCHLPGGEGRPENASLAGLPAQYIIRQVRDIASHARRIPWPGAEYLPAAFMTTVAGDVTDAETAEAAEYVTYVPAGSVERGRKLATSGDDRTLPCAGCHGPELRGVGEIPPIAGRSPLYLLRQLIAFRTGARASTAGTVMQPVVAHLELNDMIAIAAYVGSLGP